MPNISCINHFGHKIVLRVHFVTVPTQESLLLEALLFPCVIILPLHLTLMYLRQPNQRE